MIGDFNTGKPDSQITSVLKLLFLKHTISVSGAFLLLKLLQSSVDGHDC